jgi:hypothetical protein
MNVWALKWFCSDTNSYDFIDKLFHGRDNAIDFVLDSCPNIDWRIQNETEEQTEMWNADIWEYPHKSRLDVATFLITRCEVR